VVSLLSIWFLFEKKRSFNRPASKGSTEQGQDKRQVHFEKEGEIKQREKKKGQIHS